MSMSERRPPVAAVAGAVLSAVLALTLASGVVRLAVDVLAILGSTARGDHVRWLTAAISLGILLAAGVAAGHAAVVVSLIRGSGGADVRATIVAALTLVVALAFAGTYMPRLAIIIACGALGVAALVNLPAVGRWLAPAE